MSDKLSFSQRYEYTPLKKMQIECIDEDLRTALWNAHCYTLGTIYADNESLTMNMLENIWYIDFKNRIDDDIIFEEYKEEIEELIFHGIWYNIFNYIEIFLSHIKKEFSKRYLESVLFFNEALEKEKSAYRIVDGLVTPITDVIEIKSIENILRESENRFKGVNIHLKSALSLLSNKENPNYRKSIDESITAVESICSLICGDSKLSLGKALSKIERDGLVQINGTLKDAYSKIYGYTSGDSGIRHAMTDEPDLDYEDAKYMLVSCTSFINYLIVKADKAGIFEDKS